MKRRDIMALSVAFPLTLAASSTNAGENGGALKAAGNELRLMSDFLKLERGIAALFRGLSTGLINDLSGVVIIKHIESRGGAYIITDTLDNVRGELAGIFASMSRNDASGPEADARATSLKERLAAFYAASIKMGALLEAGDTIGATEVYRDDVYEEYQALFGETYTQVSELDSRIAKRLRDAT